jgi:membrane protease YdiL (CAAX protease family)
VADRPPVWPVFGAYVGAIALGILLFGLADGVVRSANPELSEGLRLETLPGLLTGVVTSSTGLMLTTLIASRGAPLAGLRLLPGRETGRGLIVMIVGMLALGQMLDSLTMLAGLAQQGAMAAIRQALAGAAGPELFLAVVVIGVLAGTAEEVFFRAYMQTRLGQRLSPAVAVVVVSACFGILHVDWMHRVWLHAVLAFALGLYLGWVTELAGSALPAVTCHVINNALFTMLTALWGTLDGFALNAGLAAVSSLAFIGCVLWLRHSRPALPA